MFFWQKSTHMSFCFLIIYFRLNIRIHFLWKLTTSKVCIGKTFFSWPIKDSKFLIIWYCLCIFKLSFWYFKLSRILDIIFASIYTFPEEPDKLTFDRFSSMSICLYHFDIVFCCSASLHKIEFSCFINWQTWQICWFPTSCIFIKKLLEMKTIGCITKFFKSNRVFMKLKSLYKLKQFRYFKKIK